MQTIVKERNDIMKITKVWANEILDSRGNPTVRAYVENDFGDVGVASVPSGASTGQYEALELRDNDGRYMGKGVLKAVSNVNTHICEILKGTDILNQKKIDRLMIEGDGTENKEKFGANATLAVSLACADLGAKSLGIPLYQYLGGQFGTILPTPMLNIINGGAHANNNIDIQEFMLFPNGFGSFQEKIHASTRVYHTLKTLIKGSTAVGDEGGFAPNLEKDEDALDLICDAIEKSGYKAGKHFSLCLDIASSEWYKEGRYFMPKAQKEVTADELISYYKKLCADYPIYSLEDPMAETDFEGFDKITKELGDKIQIVGDDLFVTNTKRLKEGIERKMANAILIKPNQIGTLTETLDAIRMAQENGFNTIISHRSGETCDTKIADIAVATNAGQIKTGAPARSDRTEKYNRLIEIEEEIA